MIKQLCCLTIDSSNKKYFDFLQLIEGKCSTGLVGWQIEEAIKLADASGDGEVDFDEFLHFVLAV